jgi:hypothetical protein
MDMLNELLGGSQQRQDYDDFIRRYDQGAPWEGIGDDEALDRYRQVAPRLSTDQYRDSATEAFRRLTPQQRAEFGRWLQQRSRHEGIGLSGLETADALDDPAVLASATAQAREQQPGLLEGSLGTGGAGASPLGSPIAKAALGGIAAMAVSKVMGNR